MAGLALLSSSSSPLVFTPSPKPTLFPLASPSPTNLSFHGTLHNNFRCLTNPSRSTKLSALGGVEDQLEEAFFGSHHQEVENYDDDDNSDDEEDEAEESSLDLLFRFLHSLYNKVSKKAKKATRSVLPPLIAPQLVSFAVDGVLLLTSLSIVRAFLEVACTLGSTVFIGILLLRLVWATISHFQSSGSRFSEGGNSYGPTQPAI